MARLTWTDMRLGVRTLHSLLLRTAVARAKRARPTLFGPTLFVAVVALALSVGLAAQIVVPSRELRTPAPGQPGQRLVPVGPGSISGIVVSGTTSRPIPGATVMLQGTAGPPVGADGTIPPPPVVTARAPSGGSPPPAGPMHLSLSRTVTTDAQGRFAFPALAAGQYSVRVTREGYLPGGSGQERPGGSVGQMRLADGEHASLTISLMRGGAITGYVYDEAGELVQGAQVRALRFVMRHGVRQSQVSASASTDDRGAFRLFGLSPGEYLVAATPRPRPPQPLPDITAQEMAAIAVATAEGRVHAGAVPGYHPAYVLLPAPSPPTRDIGGGLSTSAIQFVPIFAPGTADRANATVVRVAAGEEHGPYNIVLQSMTATLVRGVITPALPEGVSVQVALSPVDPALGDAMRTGSDPTGVFRFQNVPPGRYHLLAQTLVRRTLTAFADGPAAASTRSGRALVPRATEPPPTLWAREEIMVSGEPEIDVRLVLGAPRTLSGRLVFDMPQRQGSSALRVMLNPAPGPTSLPIGGTLHAPVEAGGTFTIPNVVPGRYILRASGGLVRSSVVEGQDTLDIPIEITGERDITGAVVTVTSPDRQTTLWGRIADRSDEPLSNVTVVVAATDERYWVPGGRRVVVSRTDAWGQYRVGGLPPGSYTVAPAHDLEDGEQFDPDLLRAIAARGGRVTLSEGVSSRQDFRTQ